MIRSAALGLAALGLAVPALADEGGPIRGGEHDGFTRIVLIIEPTTEWSLESGAGRATLHFPGKALSFGTDEVFDKIPQTRVTGVASSNDSGGTTVTVDLGCDCRISTSFVGARYLALDIADRDAVLPVAEAAPPPEPVESPEARVARETLAVSSAEQVLIRQIERAASQGLVRMSDPDAPPPAEESTTVAIVQPEPAAEPIPEKSAAPEPQAAAHPESATEVPAPKPVAEPTSLDPTSELLAVLDHDQIEATTVFDRDSRNARGKGEVPAKVASACLPDDRLDVGAWSNGLSLAAQLPLLRRQLVGEFDTPSPEAVRDLARLYVRFGFGAEVQAVLQSFPDTEVGDRALLADLARSVEAGRGVPDGPLAVAEPCPGNHGLWQALGGITPPFRDPASFAAVQAAFAALPTDLRVLMAPGFVGRLLDAGHPVEARLIYDTAVRPGQPLDAALELAAARLAAAEGQPLEAAKALTALIEADGHASIEALTQLTRVVLDAKLPIPDRVVTDLNAAALQFRGSEAEPGLRGLLVEALARRAELAEAIRVARAAMHDLPGAPVDFEALAVGALAEADPAAVGPAAWTETVLAAADLIGRSLADDPVRTAVAAHLVELGLPDPALAVLAPAVAAGNGDARLLAAEARLRLGQADAARQTLGTLQGTEATEIRARAFALTGAYDRALATLASNGMTDKAAAYAWPSGDWARASAAATDDPARLAMATYMTVETGAAVAPAPAADPATLAPEAAFQEPLPQLERPSLDAARRLLSTGTQVNGFVQNLLTPEPVSPAN